MTSHTMTSSSNKRKNSEGKEQKISRQKLDIQILHDAERAWLTFKWKRGSLYSSFHWQN